MKKLPALFCATLACSVPVAAQEALGDKLVVDEAVATEDGARFALEALMAASNERIPTDSNCNDNYGQIGSAKVMHLLLRELPGFDQGRNRIIGQCAGTAERRCKLSLYHSHDEEKSSTHLAFTVRGGKLVRSSLLCLMSP